MNIPILIAALTFLSVLLVSMGIFYYVRQRARKQKLLAKIQQGEERPEAPDIGTLSSKAREIKEKGVLNFLGSFGKRVKPGKSIDYSRMRVKFLKAGLRRQDMLYIFWGIRGFLLMLLPVSFFLLRITVFEVVSYPLMLTITIFLAILAFYLPDIWLRLKIRGRKEKLSEGFADVLDLLQVCVEAGMGLDQAFNLVADEIRLSNKVWYEELNLFRLELRAGKLRRDALKNLAVRTDIADVNSLATLLIQADRFGTSVAQTLKVYSETFRTKRYQMAEEIAAKLPVKLVIPLILFIFPALFVAILGPAVIRVSQALLHH